MDSPLIISLYADPSYVLNLHTCERNDIDNEQFRVISSFEANQFGDFETNYNLAKFKGQPSSTYNCHGLTFASKRTGIYSDDEIEKILKDDSYIEVKNEKEVLPGDVIIYYENNKITHSGIVIDVRLDNLLVSITVLSKWAKFKEVIHNANYSPYSTGAKRYWRISHGFKIV